MKQKLTGHKGSVLIIAMIFMFALLVLVVVLINNIVADTHFQSGETNEAQALYLAEAGINKVVYYLKNTAPDGSTNGSWRTSAYVYPNGTISSVACTVTPSDPCQEPLTLSGGTYAFTTYPTSNQVVGTYTVWVASVTSGQYSGDIQIISQGSTYGITRTFQEMVTPPSSIAMVNGSWKECLPTGC